MPGLRFQYVCFRENSAESLIELCHKSAVYAYNSAITFSAEVHQIWLRKTTLATVLFALTRYLPLLENVVAVAMMSLNSLDHLVSFESTSSRKEASFEICIDVSLCFCVA